MHDPPSAGWAPAPRRHRRASLLIATALIALAAMLLLPGKAAAAPPVLLSATQTDRHITATWELPPGTEASFVEVARDPTTYGDGEFLDSEDGDVLEPDQTTWTSPDPLPPGTWYVHVSGFDPECDTCPIEEWSNVLTVEIPRPVPEPGRYLGRTEFPDSKRVSFKLSDDLTRVGGITVAFTLDCFFRGFPVGEFKVKRAPIGGTPLAADGSFARLVRVPLRGGATISIRLRGKLRPPDRAAGTLRVRAKIRGGVRCRNLFGTVSWTARHR